MGVFLTFSLSISCMSDGSFPGRICFMMKPYSFCIPVASGFVSPSRSQLQIKGCSFMYSWCLLHPLWIYACICSAESPIHTRNNIARFHRPCSCTARDFQFGLSAQPSRLEPAVLCATIRISFIILKNPFHSLL